MPHHLRVRSALFSGVLLATLAVGAVPANIRAA